jgi:hypothetical protein
MKLSENKTKEKWKLSAVSLSLEKDRVARVNRRQSREARKRCGQLA